MLVIWFLAIYMLILIILANVETVYFHYIPKKYGIKYPMVDGIAFSFLPSRKLIQQTLEKYQNTDVESVLIRFLKFHNFIVIFGYVFFVLLILFVVTVLILKG